MTPQTSQVLVRAESAPEASPTRREILLVDADLALRAETACVFADAGWSVRAVRTAREALLAAAALPPDVAIIDAELPDQSGLELCANLRQRPGLAPRVIIFSERSGEADIARGFEAGADDYVVKPCRPLELIARAGAAARRFRESAVRAELTLGPLTVDLEARQVLINGGALPLTHTEFEIVRALASAPERIWSRADLLDRVWRTSWTGYVRNVDCHVARLRKKLESAGVDPRLITTVRGLGYRVR